MKKEIPVITAKEPNESLPEGTISFQELSEYNNVNLDVLKEVRRKPEDIAILPYSSGTTGLPKGVEITTSNLVINCLQQDVEGVKQYYDTTGKILNNNYFRNVSDNHAIWYPKLGISMYFELN